MGVILETNQLCKFYGTGENQVKAVNHVNIQIGQGEFVAIVGKSGSGKRNLRLPAFLSVPILTRKFW